MTPADLKIRREALALSQQWVAERLGVQDRAVRRWEAGERAIPDDVEDLLDEIEQHTQFIVDSTVDAIEDLIDAMREAPLGVDVAAYESDESLWAVHPEFAPRGASWHRAMLARVRDLLDVDVVFHFSASDGDIESGR